MARVEHTCTGCVPIDASIIDVYVTLVETNKSVTNAEAGRTEAEAARVVAETQRTATFATDHSRAVADHSIAQSDHATAGQDHTSTVAATNAATAAAAVANAKAELVQARLDTADADHTRAEGDHSTAVSDHSTASSDHTAAQSDHATAGTDHTRAESDHSTAASDHTASGTATAAATAAATLATEKAALVQDKLDRADTDHTRAESDHATAVSDHGIAGTDHTTAASDHTTASADHTLAGADHTTAASDHTTAGSDHTLAASDHTTAGADHTQALADHEVMAGYDNRLTAVEGDVTELEAKVDGLYETATGWESGYIQNDQGVGNTCPMTVTDNPYYYHLVLNIDTSCKYIVNGTGAWSIRLWSFLDEDNKILSAAAGNTSASGNTLVLTPPSNAAKLLVNSNGMGSCYITADGLMTRVSSLETQVGTIDQKLYELLDGYVYMGYISDGSYNPGTPGVKVFYLVDSVNTYSYFRDSGNVQLKVENGDGMCAFMYDGTAWSKVVLYSSEHSITRNPYLCKAIRDLAGVETTISSGQINATYGSVGTSAYIKHTDFIPLNGNGFSCYTSAGSNIASVAWYDKTKKFIGANQSSSFVSKTAAEMVAVGAEYIRCSISNTQVDRGTWYICVGGVHNNSVKITSLRDKLDLVPDATSWTYQAIQANLTLTNNNNYLLSSPFLARKGDFVKIKTDSADTLVVLAECTSEGNLTSALINANSGGELYEYSYEFTEDKYIRICYKFITSGSYAHFWNNEPLALTHLAEKIENVNNNIRYDLLGEERSQEVISSAGVSYVNRFYGDFRKGDIFKVVVRGDNIVSSGGIPFIDDATTILHRFDLSETNEEMQYLKLPKDTKYIGLGVASSFVSSAGSIRLTIKRSRSGLSKIGGIYLYPFRAIAGKPLYLYKDALFTGLKPLLNFEVRPSQKTPANLLINYSKKCLKVDVPNGSPWPIIVEVSDANGNMVCDMKRVTFTGRTMPEAKLSNVDGLDVFFLGDSLINQNGNLIGREFRRMLSTDDAGGTQEDSSVLLPALNICPGKINLVGEQSSGSTHWQYVWQLAQLFSMQNREYDYGDSQITASYWQTHNPFYNPNSTQPDEMGADGFNKRVDFAWYFQNACGNGKYPRLIYISLGANDYGGADSWSGEICPTNATRIVALCKKIKAACDSIAGGESGIIIKVINHQTYPLTSASTGTGHLPIEQARGVQLLNYDLYYEALTDPANGISSYAELIDCGSRFDWINGYDHQPTATNARCTATDDDFILETIHMNEVGAYNYADALIDDFIVDTRFD